MNHVFTYILTYLLTVLRRTCLLLWHLCALSGWNELLIASFSHQSVTSRDSIVLATGLHVYRNTAHQVGIGPIFDRILTELVSKMREMLMDKTELGCLRAIVLFNPGTCGAYVIS